MCFRVRWRSMSATRRSCRSWIVRAESSSDMSGSVVLRSVGFVMVPAYPGRPVGKLSRPLRQGGSVATSLLVEPLPHLFERAAEQSRHVHLADADQLGDLGL